MLTESTRGTGRGRGAGLKIFLAGTVLIVPFVLGSCSSTPEWAQPTEWWDAVAGDDEDEKVKEARAQDEQPYPSLSGTPARPQPGTTSAERAEIKQELAADREAARYTDQTLRASGARSADAATAPAPAPAPASSGAATATTTAAAKPPAPEPASSSALASGSSASSSASTAAAAGTTSQGIDTTMKASTSATDPGRPMSVPSIVQRRPDEVPQSSRIEELTRPPGSSASTSTTTSSSYASTTASAPSPAPAPVAAPAPATTTAMATTAAAATTATNGAAKSVAQPGHVAAATAPAPPPVTPATMQVAAKLPVGQDQSTLAQVFAANVVAQSSRSFPDAKGTVFQAPSAPPISQWGAAIPPIVRDTYNAALNESAPATAAGAPLPQFAPGAPATVVHFGHGSASVDAKGRRLLRQFAAEAKQSGGFVRVVGHASQRTGDMPYSRHKATNFNLSVDRANAVAKELRKQGVPSQRILVEARGDQDPLYFEFMPNGEAQNRRVEVFLQ